MCREQRGLPVSPVCHQEHRILPSAARSKAGPRHSGITDGWALFPWEPRGPAACLHREPRGFGIMTLGVGAEPSQPRSAVSAPGCMRSLRSRVSGARQATELPPPGKAAARGEWEGAAQRGSSSALDLPQDKAELRRVAFLFPLFLLLLPPLPPPAVAPLP